MFSSEAFLLLAENRQRDDSAFYAQVKDRIHALHIQPMRQLTAQINEQMRLLDPQMTLDPMKQVSRIRRDTRFAKNRGMFRSNVWVMFWRAKSAGSGFLEREPFPGMWFEVEPERGVWTCGVFLCAATPAVMREIHEAMRTDTQAFLEAIQSCAAAGCTLSADSYKKDRSGEAPAALKPFLNAKGITMLYESADMGVLLDGSIADILKKKYKALEPLYRWLDAHC